ncbi:unnamed protein product [Paramecium sonneborni]|uniref:J domain-containing protein n=1 Tax=Paramecium sonneborni TaxID=65129 RepID=A0A8S1Q266_9CILI|nr:unnamed protein product [Paramecium sonneborni]
MFYKLKFFFSQLKFNPNKNYYQTLNLTNKATQDEIKSAFYNLAKLHHPDKNPNSVELFKAINEAYEVLKNPITKKEYDEIQSNPIKYQKQKYERQYYQQNSYKEYDINEEQFRKMYDEYKKQQAYKQYHFYSSSRYDYQDPFKSYSKYMKDDQFDNYSNPNQTTRYLLIFMMAASVFIFSEFLDLFANNKKVILIDQITGQQYVTTRQELKNQQSYISRERQEYERRKTEFKIMQQEDLRKIRQRKLQQIVDN